MGGWQSKVRHDPVNPRRLRDVLKAGEITQIVPDGGKELYEDLLNLTAPEFHMFSMSMLVVGMGLCIEDQDRGKKLKKRWNAHIKVRNQMAEGISVAMYFQDVFEGEVAIESGQTGRLPLPTEVDFEQEFPLSPILNDRRLDIRFSDGAVVKYGCGALNGGLHKGDMVVDTDRSIISCEEFSEEVLTAEQEEEGEGIRDFMAEAGDPLCVPLTDDATAKIQALVNRCVPAAAKTQ
jgi:hypothetical protein